MGKGVLNGSVGGYDKSMRLRPVLLTALPTAFVLGTLVLPLAAHATGIPYFGPIVGPKDSEVLTCAAGFGALADLVNNAIAFLITILILFIAPFMIAWAGFLYVVSPGNPAMRTKASGILLNTAVGIAVALAAWLIVNALLAALTVKDGTKGGVAAWTSVMFSTTADKCLISTAQLNKEFSQAEGQTGLGTGGGSAEGVTCQTGSEQVGTTKCSNPDSGEYSLPNGYSCPERGTFDNETGDCRVCTEGGCDMVAPTGPADDAGRSVPLNSSGTAGCDPSIVSKAAADGGYPLTNAQANTLACISKGEDACGSGPVRNYKWGKGSSAAGAYQVTMQSHSSCFDNPVCQKAVGLTGPLNCKSGFSGGNPIPGATVVDTCLKAAANIECSAAAAACLVKANPSFSDWAPYSASNAACVRDNR